MVEKLEGIIISDPSYDKNTKGYDGKPIRYENDIIAFNWNLVFESEIEHDDYYDCDTILFNVILGKKEIVNKINVNDNGFSYPSTCDIKCYEIGMDRACFCMGSKKNFAMYGEEMAINTGTDGFLGNCYEIKLHMLQSEYPDAILFMGAIDADFISEKELFETICAGFDAKVLELNKNKSLNTKVNEAVQKQMNEEIQSDTIKDLIQIGFGRKSDFKATVWKYANQLMEVLADEGLVVEHDYGRGKGKWDIKDNKMSISDVVLHAKDLEHPKIADIVVKFEAYKVRLEKER